MTTNTNIDHFLGNIRGGDTRLRRRRGENFAPNVLVVLQEMILARAECAEKILPPQPLASPATGRPAEIINLVS